MGDWKTGHPFKRRGQPLRNYYRSQEIPKGKLDGKGLRSATGTDSGNEVRRGAVWIYQGLMLWDGVFPEADESEDCGKWGRVFTSQKMG